MGVSIRGDKSICLPVGSEEQYQQLIANNYNYRAYLLQLYAKYPEIFPTGMEAGFSFHSCGWSPANRNCQCAALS